LGGTGSSVEAPSGSAYSTPGATAQHYNVSCTLPALLTNSVLLLLLLLLLLLS
jgi:hypothetical protein